MVGDVCGLSIGLVSFVPIEEQKVRLVSGSVVCQCLSFFIHHFGVSAWFLKCTKHMGCNSDVVQ
jgi:hypothetical protein